MLISREITSMKDGGLAKLIQKIRNHVLNRNCVILFFIEDKTVLFSVSYKGQDIFKVGDIIAEKKMMEMKRLNANRPVNYEPTTEEKLESLIHVATEGLKNLDKVVEI